MKDPRVHRCLEAGLTILVGTVDANGTPSCCRGIAVTSDDELETATVYLPVATSHEAIQNVATTGRLAIGVVHPLENTATQLKGTTTEARLAREDEAAFVHARADAFTAMVEVAGVPRRLMRTVAYWPAFAVSMRVDQIFDQTPGPNAGGRLR